MLSELHIFKIKGGELHFFMNELSQFSSMISEINHQR